MNRCSCLLLAVALLASAGCPATKSPSPVPAAPRTPLRVMVVDDPPLAAALAREWLAHTEEKLDLIEVTREQAQVAQQLPVDIVIYEPALLGQFAAADLLLSLEEAVLAEPEYQRDEILPQLRSHETTWGRQTLAIPLGSPQLVLFYRTDLFDKEQLKPPRTWQEYSQAVEKFLQKPANVEVEEELWRATAEPLGNGWAAKLLLARAAASGLHRDQLSPLWSLEKLEPLIAGPPWIRALEQLAHDHKASGGKIEPLSPADCFQKFLAGESALAITWPQQLPEGTKTTLQPQQIGMTLLPGSSEVFQPIAGEWEQLPADQNPHVPLFATSGRVASVTRASGQSRRATQLLLWLGGPAQSGRILAVSPATTVFRAAHVRSGNWQAGESLQPLLATYYPLLESVQENPRRIVAPRMPGQHEYLAALEAAVLSAVKEEKSAAEILQTAADEWRKITAARGVDAQKRELRRSLGIGE